MSLGMWDLRRRDVGCGDVNNDCFIPRQSHFVSFHTIVNLILECGIGDINKTY